jgi:hypothetical protein
MSEIRNGFSVSVKINFPPFISKAVLNLSVDFRSRRFAFRGRPGEPPRRFTPAGSPLTRASRRSLRAWNEGQQSLNINSVL